MSQVNNVRRFFVSGRVQGVFFRASTREQARALDVSGYARNLADGRVEVLAAGSAAAIDALGEWLWTGPPSSQVTSVEVEEVNLVERDAFNGDFKIR